MGKFRRSVMVSGILLLGIATAPAIDAIGAPRSQTTYLTFNRPVALPGVSLGSGTYIFEIADGDTAGARSVVRVLSRDRSQVYLSAFTREVRRPSGLGTDTRVSFAEAPGDVPQPITVWWPPYQSSGHAFVYPTHR